MLVAPVIVHDERLVRDERTRRRRPIVRRVLMPVDAAGKTFAWWSAPVETGSCGSWSPGGNWSMKPRIDSTSWSGASSAPLASMRRCLGAASMRRPLALAARGRSRMECDARGLERATQADRLEAGRRSGCGQGQRGSTSTKPLSSSVRFRSASGPARVAPKRSSCSASWPLSISHTSACWSVGRTSAWPTERAR